MPVPDCLHYGCYCSYRYSMQWWQLEL